MSRSALYEDKPYKLAGGINSGLLRELNSIPVVETASAFVSNAQKESRVIRTGMAILEYSLTSVAGAMFRGGLPIFASIDSAAEKGLVTLKEKYPAMTQSPEELQDTAYSTVRKTVRMAMKTPPGRVLISGLDWAIRKSTSTLKHLGTNHKQPKHSDRESLKLVFLVIAEHAYASEDSGAFEPELKSSSKEPLAALSALTEKDSILSKAYKLGVIYPMERLVSILRYIRWYCGGSRRLDKKSVTNLAARRTIKSPRKRIRSTILTNMKNAALKLLGASSQGRLLGIYFKSTSNSPVSPSSSDRKRPHDEILTDEETDDSLADFDMDNYDSEEDPDYEPQDSGEDSDDMSSEGDPESDLEGDHIEVLTNGDFLPKTRMKVVKADTPAGRPSDKVTLLGGTKPSTPDGSITSLLDKGKSINGTTDSSGRPTPQDKDRKSTTDSKDKESPQCVKIPMQDSKQGKPPNEDTKTAKVDPNATQDARKMSPDGKKGKNKKGSHKITSPESKVTFTKTEVKGKDGKSISEVMNPSVLLKNIAPPTDNKSSNECLD